MRLDAYLVETGHFKSRARAKTAILEGNVSVGGIIVRKPSKDIIAGEEVRVEEGLDMPKGYFKLKKIQEATGMITENDSVLDLGSSAGGFVLYASEIAAKVRGVEFSRDFRTELKKIEYEKDNVSIVFADVFQAPLKELSPEPVDVLLIDMTLEPLDSIQALERVSPLLKTGGNLLLVIKIANIEDSHSFIEMVEDGGFRILNVIDPEQMEIYVIGEKESS
ncbi:MAG: S4 domain-containing protein [Methanolobus sp.]|uniref:SAM-dependent methyltransferase n=1 Tax=Methanolobus sp. TaxID=1874737 RepID=UPI002731AC86|nr:SAM-dependent methyltransferase [Methanolobus sp.]MDP2217786.1 S4 domain-containing protein [Methanolobus sp.]